MAAKLGNHHWVDSHDGDEATHICELCYCEWRGSRVGKDGEVLGPGRAGGCGAYRVPPHMEWSNVRPECVQ